MTAAAVLGGGSGSRMNSKLPKQFLRIKYVPVIIMSIQAFLQNPNVDICIVCVPENYVKYTEKLINEYIPAADNVTVIPGGATRGESLKCVLAYLNDKNALDDCILLTHDAVRPFITSRIIDENIETAKKYGACTTCIPATDTMLISLDGSVVEKVPDRKTVYHAQTPQSFNAKMLFELINVTPKDVFDGLTDGAAVFSCNNKPVHIVMGEDYNIKITYPQDIVRAEQILNELYSD